MPITTPVAAQGVVQNANTALSNPAFTGPAALANAATAGQAAQYNATNIDLNALERAKATTSAEQLSGILNKGGALMQQSATMGNQQAAARGLLNSSMGIQAAQNAMIANASPLAQNDANQLNNMAQFNAGVRNQAIGTNAAAQNAASQWNAGATNQMNQYNASNQQQTNLANQQATNQQNQYNASNQQQTNLQNQQAQNSMNQFNAGQQNSMNQWNAGQQNEMIKQALDVNSREQLANIEANYKALLQTNASASNMYEQYLKNLSDISVSKDLDAYAKQDAINNQTAYLRSAMRMLESLNNVQGLVQF